MRIVERTDFTELVAWMRTSGCLPADTNLPSAAITEDVVSSAETFTVNLPLKSTMEASAAALGSDIRFDGFLKLDIQNSFMIDRGFTRLFDEVKNAILNKHTLIHIKGLHRCFTVWLRLIFELLTFDVPDCPEHDDLSKRHLFFFRKDHLDEKVNVYVAFNRSLMVKEMDSISDAVDFACSFDQAIILYDKTVSRKLVKRRHLCLVLGELPTGTKGHCIDFWQPEHAMGTAYPLFLRCIGLYYEGEFGKRDLNTLYHVCSGNLETLDSMAASECLFFKEAKKPIDFYIGSPIDNDSVAKLGEKVAGDDQGFFDQIQFDEVPIVVDRIRANVATTIVLCNPAKHREGEPLMSLGLETPTSLNFPKPSSKTNQNLYILSPSQSMFDDAAKNPVILDNIQLPGYFVLEEDEPLKNDRWHFIDDDDSRRLKVETPILFSISAKTLYTMVEALTKNLDSVKCRSWHITGVYGTGKSTALLICQSLWFKRPSSFRVAYLPHAGMFLDDDISFAETFRLMVSYAFLRDPVQQNIHDIALKDVNGLFDVLESFLESRNLLFVIIIDHLNEVMDRAEKAARRAWKFIESQVRPSLRKGDFKRILLVTAASPINLSAQYKDSISDDLMIDFFNGFNKFESEWMIDRFFKGEDANPKAREIKKLTEPLGVLPIETDFTIDAEVLEIGCAAVNPTINDTIIRERIDELKKGVSRRFTSFAKEDAALKIRKYRSLMNVLYLNLLNLCNYTTIDRRFVKPVLCPRQWDLLKDHVIDGNLSLNVMPLPISDITGYEDWLLEPTFRQALSLAPPQVCLLACSQLARQALHKVHLKNLHSSVCLELFSTAPSCADLLLEEAFERDILNSACIRAHRVEFASSGMAQMESEPTELFCFEKRVEYHTTPCALTTATIWQRRLNIQKRLESVGILPDGCLNLFRMRGDDIDFCLIQNHPQQTPKCVVVRNAIAGDVQTLKTEFLLTAYMVGTQRQARLPILFAKREPVTLLFVCGSNFFEEEDGGQVVNREAPTAKKPRAATGKRRVLKADPASCTSTADYYTNDYKNWSCAKLMAQVEQLVRLKHLEIYVVAVQDEPKGSFDMSRLVHKKYREAMLWVGWLP